MSETQSFPGRQRLARWLRAHTSSRGAAIIAGGTAAGQLIVAAASPILTRLYSPAEIGAFAVYASLLSTLVPVACLRYEVAIPLPEDNTDGHAVLLDALIAAVATSTLVFVLLLLAGGEIASAVHLAELRELLWLLPLGLLAAGAFQAFVFAGIRDGVFKSLGGVRIVQPSAQAGSQIALGIAGLGLSGMIVGDVVGRSTGSIWLALRLHLNERLAGAWSHARAMAKRYRRFPLVGSWSALANSAGVHLTPFLVALVFGSPQAAWFTVGQRVMALPTTIVGVAIGQVYTHDLAEMRRNSTRGPRTLFARAARQLLTWGVVFYVPAFLLAPVAFRIVFGPTYEIAGQYMRIASLMFLTQFVAGALSQTLNIMERQGLQLAWDVCRLVTCIAVFAIASSHGWDIELTLLVFSLSMSALYVVLLGLSYRVLGQSQ